MHDEDLHTRTQNEGSSVHMHSTVYRMMYNKHACVYMMKASKAPNMVSSACIYTVQGIRMYIYVRSARLELFTERQLYHGGDF